MDPSRQEFIMEALKPLQEHQASVEYYHQNRSLNEFYECLQTLEMRYAELFEQAMAIEKKLSLHP